ncbi:MAG: glycosyltransferase family 4 protein [Thiogranum sp.]
MPRSGGIAIVASIFAGSLAVALVIHLPGDGAVALFSAALLVAAVSFLDDRFSLNAGVRLLVHSGAAWWLLGSGFLPQSFVLPGTILWWPAPVAWIAGMLFVVWLTNLYNFMDGMDGFAAGMAGFGFSAYALLGFLGGDTLFALLSLVVAASAAGFLLFNFPPARIFMGDTGASTLGFLVAAFSLWADRDGLFPLWTGLLVFSPFIVDATVTLFRRLLKGKKIWEAHRSHYYQRLVQLGWGHRRTVLAEYGLMLASAAGAIAAMQLGVASQWLIGGIWILFYLSAMVALPVAERRAGAGR